MPEDNLPIAEFVDTAKEFKWRIKYKGEKSPWSHHYQGLLVHTFSNGRKFALATAYWDGVLTIEKPFEIIEL